MTASAIKKYLASIGSKGGKKSKRVLTPEQARAMVKAREAKKKQHIDVEKLNTLTGK
jgi:hypothetical protein